VPEWFGRSLERHYAENLTVFARKGAGEMSVNFVDELQAQVDKLEKEILEAEAAGKDSAGDRLALSHLKALLEQLRRK